MGGIGCPGCGQVQAGPQHPEPEDIDFAVFKKRLCKPRHGEGGGPGNGGGFLAANTAAGWVLVWHGNGVYMCDDLAPYDFPPSMSEGCYAGP